jgi:hypothetical protein
MPYARAASRLFLSKSLEFELAAEPPQATYIAGSNRCLGTANYTDKHSQKSGRNSGCQIVRFRQESTFPSEQVAVRRKSGDRDIERFAIEHQREYRGRK